MSDLLKFNYARRLEKEANNAESLILLLKEKYP
jgi:hypothetical protein